ncbi:protein transporter, partial [Reticulomyxa filosa]
MFPNENRREFQRGIDTEVSKVKRFEERLNLRKQTREGYLNKRRKALNEPTDKSSDNKSESSRFSSTPGEVVVKGPPIPSWVRLENLDKFADSAKSNDLEQTFNGVQAIRQLLSVEEKPPIEQVFKTGVVPHLVNILHKKVQCEDFREKTPEEEKKCKLQFEAAWYIFQLFKK